MFFRTVRGHMRAQDYRVFGVVEKSHRRFHSDRWNARGLLAAVGDDDVRGMIEVIANTGCAHLSRLIHSPIYDCRCLFNISYC